MHRSIVAHQLDPVSGTPFRDGSRRATVDLATARIGLGIYNPGWRWSTHARRSPDITSARHVGYVISGVMAVSDRDGSVVVAGPSHAFEADPDHDAWVVGDEPCIALDVAPLRPVTDDPGVGTFGH